MICNIVLYYTLVFMDGHKEAHTKWVDKETAAIYSAMFQNPKDINPPNCCSAIIDINFKEVAPYDCYKGPKEIPIHEPKGS